MKRLGELKVKTVSELLEHANNWADGEDCVRNEQPRTPEYDDPDGELEYESSRHFGRKKKRSRHNFHDDRDIEMVAAGFPDDRGDKRHEDNR